MGIQSPMPEYTSFWDRLEIIPPILIRLLAKKGQEPMTTAEIAKASGMTDAEVLRLSWCTSWDGVTVTEMKAFMKGCDRDWTTYAGWKKIRNYITNHQVTFKYLRRSPEFDTLLCKLSDKFTSLD